MPTCSTAWRRAPALGSNWQHSRRWVLSPWQQYAGVPECVGVPPLQERDRLQELVDHQTQEIEQVGGGGGGGGCRKVPRLVQSGM